MRAIMLCLMVTLGGCTTVVQRAEQLEDATVGDAIAAIERRHDFRAIEDIAIHNAIMGRFNACIMNATALQTQAKFAEAAAAFDVCVQTLRANRTELWIIAMARELKTAFGDLSSEQLQEAGMDARLAPLVSAAMKAHMSGAVSLE